MRLKKQNPSMIFLIVILLIAAMVAIFVPASHAEEIDVPAVVTAAPVEEGVIVDESDLLSFVQEYAIVTVVLICGILGWLIKHTLEMIPNKYIPIILAVLGIFFVAWINEWQFTFVILLQGLCSGLASVGTHQLITKMLGKYFPA